MQRAQEVLGGRWLRQKCLAPATAALARLASVATPLEAMTATAGLMRTSSWIVAGLSITGIIMSTSTRSMLAWRWRLG